MNIILTQNSLKKAEKGEIDAITLLEERKNEREEKDLRMNLFGI